MKKETKADIIFCVLLFGSAVLVPLLLRFVFFPWLEPQYFNIWEMWIYWYMNDVLPYLCIALALLHVILTRRISGWFVGSEIAFIFIGAFFLEFCLRPEDPIGRFLMDGIIHGMLLMFIPMSTFLLQAVAMPIIGFFERRQAKKNQPNA